MKIVFYSVILNNHQANVADELWRQTGGQYRFVELANLQGDNKKGDPRDYSDRPYLIRAWESEAAYSEAMELALTSVCCVFSSVLAFPFQRARLKIGLLSFEMSERWLKRGIINILSPAILRMFLAYHFWQWGKKPLYKLCCSAFATKDQRILLTFKDRCYKWGYFTRVETENVEISSGISELNATPLMWCSKYSRLKHPELPILLAQRLKEKGYYFVLDMYGSGEYESAAKTLVKSMQLDEVVHFHGNIPNVELLAAMRQHCIFIFTSDRNEGWGAVANESMSNGCVLVGADAIGSVPYLVEEKVTGFTFQSPHTNSSFNTPDSKSLNHLCEKVEWLLDHPIERFQMQKQAQRLMQQVWSPKVAAERLLTLIDNLKENKDTPFQEGPCSKA